MQGKMKIGIIGCGNISGAYFGGAQKTDVLEIKSCADIKMEAARGAAEKHGCQAVTVDELLADMAKKQDYKQLFPPQERSGDGSRRNASRVNTTDRTAMSATDKIAHGLNKKRG